MQVKVKSLGASEPFKTKSGRDSYRTPVQYPDLGARFPVGRGTLYTDSAVPPGEEITAVLISYDRGEGRFVVR